MPYVKVRMFEGHTVDEKRQMVKAVTSAICTSISVPAEAVTIVIQDLPKTNYAKAGKLRSDEAARR